MSPKRILMLALLAGGAPYWLLLRARFGGQFFAMLASVWCLQFAGLWLGAGGYIPDLPVIWMYWCQEMVLLYQLMAWIWVGQVMWWVIYEGESLLHRQGGSRPLYAGVFWLASKPSPLLDFFMAYFGAIILSMGINSVPYQLRDVAALITLASAGCFLLGSLICHANGNMLPIAVARRKPRQVKVKRYLTRSLARAKRSSEGLEQIFSRREKALRDLTRT